VGVQVSLSVCLGGLENGDIVEIGIIWVLHTRVMGSSPIVSIGSFRLVVRTLAFHVNNMSSILIRSTPCSLGENGRRDRLKIYFFIEYQFKSDSEEKRARN
ncbi:hypothetical protein ACTA71_006730, partial [Dictyostelium dimigraforme]